jgi:acetyl-CoA carboxylase biotin carboxyl carrier protein
MEIKLITQLARVMSRAKLTELEVEDEKQGLRIVLKRGSGGGGTPIVNVTQGGGGGPSSLADTGFFPAGGYFGGQGYPLGSGPLASGALGAGAAGGAPGSAAAGADAGRGWPPGTIEFKSPMVGTFYRAASPDAEPFVEVGGKFDEETVLCIVEAMKVMNEIKAETKGTVVKVLVENAEPVEYGQPLFLIQRS